MELNKKLVNFESMNENTKLTLAEALLYTKGLAGGYGGDFPLSTASKDSIYRVPATNKFYVCTENYNGSQISAPNSNFVELSVWKNHDRLANLIESVTLENSSETNVWKPIPFPKGFNADNCDFFVSSLGNSPTSNVIFKISLDKTRFTAFEFNGNKSHVVHFTFIKIK